MAPKDNKEGISRDAYDRMQSTSDTRETDSPMIPINVTPANDSSSSEAAGIRASVDAALDRIRRSTDSSERDRAPRRRRLSKLVPRRRKPARDGLADNASDNLSRRSSTVDQSLVSGPASRSQSDTSLANGGSGRSSLLTDDLGDSDVETGYVCPVSFTFHCIYCCRVIRKAKAKETLWALFANAPAGDEARG